MLLPANQRGEERGKREYRERERERNKRGFESLMFGNLFRIHDCSSAETFAFKRA